jgi:hypothetical protein
MCKAYVRLKLTQREDAVTESMLRTEWRIIALMRFHMRLLRTWLARLGLISLRKHGAVLTREVSKMEQNRVSCGGMNTERH